ncbi:TadE family protein [Massilia sp. GCM10020059]|uniref:Pilus assembly protein n=1 Tax=Massilia agrisoli TaxID=2892444 RepID=A0ABS8IQL6_9BURK|nr:TadE/TadG family type IV pilus assembly protein [Massilia agrisoli]MCC6070680.1 pilus assembly protein [Massilia agrisoli]
MPAIRPHFLPLKAQRGATAVEFAGVAVFFFTYLFAMFELARALYLWNTMTEVTRRAARAAAVADFDDAAKQAIRRHAMFDTNRLPLAGDVTIEKLEIDYLQADGATPVTALPLCPTENLVNCTANPNGPSCIRFVRVRVCLDGPGSCSQVPYTTMSGLENFVPGSLSFPRFTTISPVGSLGRTPSVTSTCP